jgi:hypothetical protein
MRKKTNQAQIIKFIGIGLIMTIYFNCNGQKNNNRFELPVKKYKNRNYGAFEKSKELISTESVSYSFGYFQTNILNKQFAQHLQNGNVKHTFGFDVCMQWAHLFPLIYVSVSNSKMSKTNLQGKHGSDTNIPH